MDEKHFALRAAAGCHRGDAHGDSAADKLGVSGVGSVRTFHYRLLTGHKAPPPNPGQLRYFTFLLAR